MLCTKKTEKISNRNLLARHKIVETPLEIHISIGFYVVKVKHIKGKPVFLMNSLLSEIKKKKKRTLNKRKRLLHGILTCCRARCQEAKCALRERTTSAHHRSLLGSILTCSRSIPVGKNRKVQLHDFVNSLTVKWMPMLPPQCKCQSGDMQLKRMKDK